MYACSQLGAIFVPLNIRFTGPELTFMIGDAGARVVITDDAHHEAIEGSETRRTCRPRARRRAGERSTRPVTRTVKRPRPPTTCRPRRLGGDELVNISKPRRDYIAFL